MKRIALAHRVVYLRRRRFASVVCLFSSGAALGVAHAFGEVSDSAFSRASLGLAALLAVGAFVLLFRMNALVIDRGAGTLSILERRAFRTRTLLNCRLAEVRVRLESFPNLNAGGSSSQRVSLILPGERQWVVAPRTSLPAGDELAWRLEQDLTVQAEGPQ